MCDFALEVLRQIDKIFILYQPKYERFKSAKDFNNVCTSIK